MELCYCECGAVSGPSAAVDRLNEDALDLLRDAACAAGVHATKALGLCGHVQWVRDAKVTAEDLNGVFQGFASNFLRRAK